MTCKQFVEGGDYTIKMVLTWMDGWYKGDSDEAIIDTDVFVENAKKFGTYCGRSDHEHRQRRGSGFGRVRLGRPDRRQGSIFYGLPLHPVETNARNDRGC